MRAQLTLEVQPDELGTNYELEIWDADREMPTRPLYTLSWRTHDSCRVDEATLLSHARHVAYVAYVRLGDEVAKQQNAWLDEAAGRRRPLAKD